MTLNAIVDLSHHNKSVDFAAAKAAGVLGVIHKATQGTTSQDATYAQRRRQAIDAGLLWGSYHFADGSDGLAQAKFFLDVVGNTSNQILVLDFEQNPNGQSMTLANARAFVTHIHDATGRWPGFYCGAYFKQILGRKVDSVIGNCWLWLAQYGGTPSIPATWKDWTMWQYTDGEHGPMPHTVDGIGPCDRDQFNGTAQELQTFWMNSIQTSVAVAS